MATNGTSPSISLQPGMYCPIVTIFAPNEDLDLPAQGSHAVRLARAGLAGIVAMGSNGEAVHLTSSERSSVISTMREALDKEDFKRIPIIAGCTAQSVRESIQLCKEAKSAGASYAICLPPCYYRPAITMDVVANYFEAVADESPLPVLMYNYPGAVAGVDIDSDTMTRIARHKNVVGAKLTCGSVGKLTRVAEAMGSDTITAANTKGSFLITGGLADMTLQTAISGGSGIIAGTANVLPKLCTRVWDLWHEGKQDEAQRLQKIVARADWTLAKAVVPATKATLEAYFGYGGKPRRPLSAIEGKAVQPFIDGIKEAMDIEKTL